MPKVQVDFTADAGPAVAAFVAVERGLEKTGTALRLVRNDAAQLDVSLRDVGFKSRESFSAVGYSLRNVGESATEAAGGIRGIGVAGGSVGPIIRRSADVGVGAMRDLLGSARGASVGTEILWKGTEEGIERVLEASAKGKAGFAALGGELKGLATSTAVGVGALAALGDQLFKLAKVSTEFKDTFAEAGIVDWIKAMAGYSDGLLDAEEANLRLNEEANRGIKQLQQQKAIADQLGISVGELRDKYGPTILEWKEAAKTNRDLAAAIEQVRDAAVAQKKAIEDTGVAVSELVKRHDEMEKGMLETRAATLAQAESFGDARQQADALAVRLATMTQEQRGMADGITQIGTAWARDVTPEMEKYYASELERLAQVTAAREAAQGTVLAQMLEVEAQSKRAAVEAAQAWRDSFANVQSSATLASGPRTAGDTRAAEKLRRSAKGGRSGDYSDELLAAAQAVEEGDIEKLKQIIDFTLGHSRAAVTGADIRFGGAERNVRGQEAVRQMAEALNRLERGGGGEARGTERNIAVEVGKAVRESLVGGIGQATGAKEIGVEVGKAVREAFGGLGASNGPVSLQLTDEGGRVLASMVSRHQARDQAPPRR